MNPSDEKIVQQALQILEAEMSKPGVVLSSPSVVANFLCIKLARAEREVFGVVWLNSQNAVIAVDDLFFGSLTSATVHPREVVKAAFAVNAGGAVLFHNHPSGNILPSEADKRITKRLEEVLDMVDVRVLDHVIVGGVNHYSFAEHGLI